MTEPSQYFKGRTVQEQMDEVIGYVDKRAEEVAAAKADDVLQPAEAAKTAAQAAAEAAEAAKNATIAALPQVQQDISGLKAEDVALDGRLNTVELKVQTTEGNIVTIQGQITAIENKNTQQDSAIAALQTADEQNVKINRINQYAVGLTGNQNIAGNKKFFSEPFAYFVSSELKQFNEQTAFMEVCIDGAFTKTIIFEFTESTGSGIGIGKFNISSTGVITEAHNTIIGDFTSKVGIVRYDGKVYLTLEGYGVFSHVYIRGGGNRRLNPIEIEAPFSVADTATYPNQQVITW